MKKIISVMLIISAVLALSSCSRRSYLNENAKKETASENTRAGFEDVTVPEREETKTSPETDPADAKREAAMEAAKSYLFENDPAGLKYAFSYDGIEMLDGTEYTKIRVSLHESEDGAYTLCGYLLVDENGNVTKYEW